MTPPGAGVFDWADRFSEAVHEADRQRRGAQRDAALNARQCGNCYWWMKRECKPEQAGSFRSAAMPACSMFLTTRDRS